VDHDGDPVRTEEYVPSAIGPDTVIAGHYKLVEKLGDGGMGEVWIAKQTEPVRRTVALKVIKAGMDTRGVLARFEQERQALAVMSHPNIAKVLDGGMTPTGQPFFAMELVPGLPLVRFCDESKLGIPERLELFISICQAVQHAHQKGIIHRDLKPANILVAHVDAVPTPKVIDFGVAKATAGKLIDESLATQFGAVIGTLEYMAPEQAGFGVADVDTRADIYALGVILYELLTGLRPFDSERLRNAPLDEKVRAIREDEPTKPSTRLSTAEELPALAAARQSEPRRLTNMLRGDLDAIVMKALEKDRNRRYETANGFAADLRRYLNAEPVTAHPPSSTYQFQKFVRKNRRAVIAGLLVLIAPLAGMAGTTYGVIRADRSRDDAVKAQLAEADQRVIAMTQAARASQSATEERAAKENLSAFIDYLLDDVLSASRPKAFDGLGRDVKLKDAIDAAAGRIGERFKGKPKAELVCRESIARTYELIGDLARAEAQLRLALPLTRSPDGSESEETWRLTRRLTSILLERGNLSEADKVIRATLDQSSRRLGPEHADTVRTQEMLARVLDARRQFPEAELLFQQVIQWREEHGGARSPETAIAYHNYAVALARVKRSADAETYFRKAYEIHAATSGPESHGALSAQNSVGASLVDQRKDREAEPILRTVLAARRRVLDADHPYTLQTQMNLAIALKSLGQLDESEQLYREALESQRRTIGPTNPMTLDTEYNLLVLLMARERYDAAVELARESLDRYRKAYGPTHSETFDMQDGLAEALICAGKAKEALPLAREILGFRRRQPKPEPMELASALATVAWALAESGQARDADAPATEAIQMFGPTRANSPTVHLLTAVRGASATARKDYEAAEKLLTAANSGLDDYVRQQVARGNAMNQGIRYRRAVVRYLIDVYSAWGKPERAAEWREKLPPVPKSNDKKP